MILTAGKSLRFLREVCGDSSEIPGHAKLIKIIREGRYRRSRECLKSITCFKIALSQRMTN